MSIGICPCIDCVPPKRTSTCHSSCQEYKDWKTAHDDRNAKIRKIKQDYYDYFLSNIKRRR